MTPIHKSQSQLVLANDIYKEKKRLMDEKDKGNFKKIVNTTMEGKIYLQLY